MLFRDKKFFLTNTVSGKREEFRPFNPPNVLYYSCGPTVYGPLHIGNARALIFGDLLHRWLKFIGYRVNFVRNYTDVDDKIIHRAHEEKTTPEAVSEKYIEYCETDIASLKLTPPTRTVKVTESISDIIELIQKIIARKHAYVVDGEVLFSIESFQEYGKLSGKKVEDLVAGARVEVDTKKKNPMDFSLWKPHKPGEPFWESPWGKGRPGWHIECSAMISKFLGDTIDLHHGGQDLIFPHHENEIAQSEAASGKSFCRHWVHHAFLTAGNEKMSKSLGNILTIREFVEKFGGELLKFIYLSFHYRSAVPYTEEMMTQALSELERIYLAKKWAHDALENPIETTEASPKWSELFGQCDQAQIRIDDELFMDLNTPGALGHLFSMIRDINRVDAQVAGKPGMHSPITREKRQVATEFLLLLEGHLQTLWGVFGEDANQMLQKIESIRRARQAAGSKNVPSDQEILHLIDERNAARKNKDFKRADDIRKQLDSSGIILVDSPQGTTWKSK